MKNFLLQILRWFQKPLIPRENKHPGFYREPASFEEQPETVTLTVKEPSRLRKWIANMSFSNFADNVWSTFLFLCVVGVLGAGSFLLSKIIFASGAVDYCYIEKWTYLSPTHKGDSKPVSDDVVPTTEAKVVVVWELRGHRAWRSDRDIVRCDDFDTALEAAKKINCSVEAK